MLKFTSQLKKEIDAKIEQIENTETCITTKARNASLVIGDGFIKLKLFITSYQFKNEDEEIYFFKEIKPKLCFRLIYYRKVYNIEMNRPTGIENQKGGCKINCVSKK